MTTANKAPDFLPWASKQLGTPEGADAGEVRTSFLKQMSDWKFLPPLSAHVGAQLLLRPNDAGLKVFLTETAAFEEEARLRQEIQKLGQEFYSLTPNQRKQRWLDLYPKCRWSPPLEATLEAYQHVFDMKVSLPEHDPDLSALIQEFQGQYLEFPLQEAIRRTQFLKETAKRPSRSSLSAFRPKKKKGGQNVSDQRFQQWREAAGRLQEKYPEVAELAQIFLAEFTAEKPEVPRPLPRPQAIHPAVEQTQPANTWWIWVIGLIFLKIIAAIIASAR